MKGSYEREAEEMANSRPNIILLIDDQHRWNALGCVNPLVATPSLDALANRGIRFDQAVCQAPACVPSRYSMMLGLYPSQTGVRTNGECLSDRRMPGPTIAEYLRDTGYQTAGFGKTHWSNPGCSTRGFDTRAIGQPRDSKLFEQGATMMSDLNPNGLAAYFQETEPFGGGEENVDGYIGCTSQVPAEDHRDGWVTQQCLQFLDSERDDSKPLFLYLSYLKPHAAFNVPVGFEDLYDIVDIPDMNISGWTEDVPGHTLGSDRRMEFFRDASPEVRRRTILRYWANCTWIDSMFGQILTKLEEQHLLDNALILYLSDHGEMLGDHYFRFSKYCLYEGSVRVPLILAGSVVPPELQNSVDKRPAELVDVLPTILDAAAIPAPPILAGNSLLAPPVRKGSFSEHHAGTHPYRAAAYMWRTNTTKLILYSNASPATTPACEQVYQSELYDLASDPLEWNNLYNDSQFAGLRESMTRSLLIHLSRSSSRFPCPERVILNRSRASNKADSPDG